MADIIDFTPFAPQPDPEEMDREQLTALLKQVREQIRRLDKLVDELARGNPLDKVLR